MAFQMSNMVRYAIRGRWSNGRPVINILDMSVRVNPDLPDVPWGPQDRADAIEAKAGDIANNWKENLLPAMTSAYTFEDVAWVDLNSANGSTGSRTADGGGAPGGLGADSQPPQTTLLISKLEGGRTRGTRPGRWYLSAVRDQDIDNNGIVLPIWRTQINNVLEAFRTGIEDQGVTDDVWGVPVVIHEKTATAGEITKFECSQKVGKQGRRYDGRA
uniref:Uncharacterized protein n=1 Tax=uncultured prokaryote TaxID=198431 RepID=A0A0H5Q3G8_9ZZZZ|nr:hypothetical protein [uncultured prokaryote]